MHALSSFNKWSLVMLLVVIMVSCSTTNEPTPLNPGMEEEEKELIEGVDYFLPHIDLNHWKVTLPIGNPTEVTPPEILNYATNDLLQDFMYNDSIDGSLVFYTYPGASTANSSYSRTELREQMDPGSNTTNWTFADRGRMKGSLKMGEISRDDNGNYHRVIIMQIHGRLTNEQRDEIGEDDNNAPPVLKIYWNQGNVRVHRKVLKDIDTPYPEILKTISWEDEAKSFNEKVDFDQFSLEVIASEGRLEVILNDNETMVWEDIHMEKWGIFENYFKAGNYLTTKDSGAYAKVKFYDLEVSH